jgi:hypothetical protein
MIKVKVVIETKGGFTLIDRITDNIPLISDYDGRTLLTSLEPRIIGINDHDIKLWIEVKSNTKVTENSELGIIVLRKASQTFDY